MQRTVKSISAAVLLMLVFMHGNNVKGQSNTMYYIYGVPQSHQLNPATQPVCDFYLGIPGVSPLQLYLQNSALSVNDVIWAEGDSVYHPFHPSVEIDDFLSNFKDLNYISTENDISAFSMGMRIREMYFTFDVGAHLNNRFIFPRELMDFLVAGNQANDEFDLSGLAFDFKNYVDFALGVSRKFGDQWTVGLKSKLLFGIANLSTSESDLNLITGADRWVIDANYDMNFSMPGVIVPIDADGTLDLDTGFDFDSTLSTFKDYRKIGTQNVGLAFDIGAHFRPIDRLEISASIIDLGFIRWKGYTFSLDQTSEFNFEGVEADRLNELDNIGDQILDTLGEMFDFNTKATKYSSMITAKIYLGARYMVTDAFDAGALIQTKIIRGNIRPQITLLANWYPSSVWGFSTSYSLLQNSYASFGIGTSFKFGPLSLYIISDNIPFSYNLIKKPPIPLPNNLRTYSIRFGANLMFGCNKKKKMRKDKPMLYLEDY